MTGFEEEVSLSTLIVKPKKSQCGWWCGVVGFQSNAGVWHVVHRLHYFKQVMMMIMPRFLLLSESCLS
jgi:hypothetical protein